MKKAKNGTRFSNLLLDSVIFTAIFWGIFWLLLQFNLSFLMEGETWGTMVYFIAYGSYYYFFEASFARTPAKFITTTKVVNMDGSRPGNKQILLRTLCRFIPFDALTFLFAESGWHDKHSDTMVIDS